MRYITEGLEVEPDLSGELGRRVQRLGLLDWYRCLPLVARGVTTSMPGHLVWLVTSVACRSIPSASQREAVPATDGR